MLVEEGKTVGINTVVARLSDGAGGAAAPAEKPAEATKPEPAPQSAQPAPQTVQPTPAAKQADEPAPRPRLRRSPAAAAESAGPLSPLVRKMARENNLDLSKVKGTGAGGRITKQDVEAHMAQGPAPAAPPPPAPAPAAAPAAAPPPFRHRRPRR